MVAFQQGSFSSPTSAGAYSLLVEVRLEFPGGEAGAREAFEYAQKLSGAATVAKNLAKILAEKLAQKSSEKGSKASREGFSSGATPETAKKKKNI